MEVANMEENNKALEKETIEEVDVQEENVQNDDEVVNVKIQELEQKIESLQKEKEETFNRLLRIQAEFDNFKKRTAKEKEADRKYKAQDLVNELLPAVDNFERALKVEVTDETKGLVDGITMVYNQVLEALKSQGVEIIESEGKEFDPNIHHAVMQVEDESMESGVIVEELQKGYLLKDRVIRPSMVKVNK